MISSNRKLNRYDIIVICCVYFAASSSLLSDSINAIALYVAIPLAFLVTFKEHNREKIDTSLKVFIVLSLWLFSTIVWAYDQQAVIRQSRQILGTLLLSYIVLQNAHKIQMLAWIYGAYLVLYISAWHYASVNILDSIDIGTQRLNDEKLNANTLAYYTFYVTIASYILGDIVAKRYLRLLWINAFLFTIPLSFFVAYATASRQVLLLQVPLIFVLLYLRYFKNVKASKKILFIFICILFAILIIPYALELYDGSLLQERNRINIGNDSRTKLVYSAIEVGIEHFFTGVGANNFIYYSYHGKFAHNTYLELFANAGIFGLILYVYIIFRCFILQLKRFKKTKDTLFLVFASFVLFFFVDNIAYVFYPYMWLMSFFFLISAHSNHHYKIRSYSK